MITSHLADNCGSNSRRMRPMCEEEGVITALDEGERNCVSAAAGTPKQTNLVVRSQSESHEFLARNHNQLKSITSTKILSFVYDKSKKRHHKNRIGCRRNKSNNNNKKIYYAFFYDIQ